MKTREFVLPKTIGAAADKLYKLRAKRLALQAQVEAMAAQENAIKEYVIKTLPKYQASGVAGRVARVQLDKRDIPQAKSWPDIYKFILKHKDFSLLQRRLNEGTVKEHWEAGEAVPGVTKFTAIVVSVTKK
jgi:hypothetical protein